MKQRHPKEGRRRSSTQEGQPERHQRRRMTQHHSKEWKGRQHHSKGVFLSFFFLFSTAEKSQISNKLLAFFFLKKKTRFQVFDIGRKRPRTNLIDHMFVTSGKVNVGSGGKCK